MQIEGKVLDVQSIISKKSGKAYHIALIKTKDFGLLKFFTPVDCTEYIDEHVTMNCSLKSGLDLSPRLVVDSIDQ